MYKTKRITSFLLVFVMVFSIFAGTVSMAAEDNQLNLAKVFNIDEGSLISPGEVEETGIKLQKTGDGVAKLLKDITKLEKGSEYTVSIDSTEYKIVSFKYNGEEIKDSKFTVKSTDVNAKVEIFLRRNNTYKVNVKATLLGEETPLNVFKTKIENVTMDASKNGVIFLVKGSTNEIFYNSVDYKLTKIDNVTNTDNKFKAISEGQTVNLVFEPVTDNNKVTFKFLAPKEVTDKVVTTSSSITDFKLNKEITVKNGKHDLSFDKIPEGYGIKVKNNGGNSISLKNNSTKTKANFDMTIFASGNVEFTVESDYFKVLVDAPKYDSTEENVNFNIYSKPSTKITGEIINGTTNSKITDFSGTTDKDGKLTISKNGRYTTKDIVNVIADTGDMIATSSVKVAGDKPELELKVDEINVGENKITGTSNGTKVKAYIYNTTSKKFTELTEANVTNGKFEINVKDGVKLGDEIYIKAMNDSTEGVYKLVKTASAVKRLSGKTRFLTAVTIAEESYPKADNVIIANGDVSADALSAGPLANELNAPILLVKSNYASQEVINYIKVAGVKNIYIVGGEGSVNNSVVNTLKPVTTTNVERIKGADRYETSLEIAKKLVDKHGYGTNNTVLIANGTDAKSADALSASTYATQKKEAIILSGNSGLTSKVKTGLTELNIKKADIVGGASSVADSVLSNANLTKVTRISGSDRYATSLAVAEKLTGVKTVVIANGYKSADALTAASLGKTKSAAIILTDGNNLTSTQDKYIADLGKLGTIYIAGGSSSVTTTMEKTLAKFIK